MERIVLTPASALTMRAHPKIDRHVKAYRKHYCTRKHRDTRTTASCLWPRAAWISGSGRWAVVSRCRGYRDQTITLHQTEENARSAIELIDASACGGRCTRTHDLIFIAC